MNNNEVNTEVNTEVADPIVKVGNRFMPISQVPRLELAYDKDSGTLSVTAFINGCPLIATCNIKEEFVSPESTMSFVCDTCEKLKTESYQQHIKQGDNNNCTACRIVASKFPNAKDNYGKYKKIMDDCKNANEPYPSIDDIAGRLGITEAESMQHLDIYMPNYANPQRPQE